MSILNPQTGNEKMDEAYKKMLAHTSGFESFEQFYNYFLKQVTTDDKEKLNKWLLKVLFVELKREHPFDEMIKVLKSKEPDKANNLITWLNNTLFEVQAKHGGKN